MTEQELLEKVKQSMNITGDYHNHTLIGYINEIKGFMTSAGVSQETIDSKEAVGCIARGVTDLWNNESGQTKLSQYFIFRVLQLKNTKTEITPTEQP